MDAQVGHLRILMERALAKAVVQPTGTGFEILAEQIHKDMKPSYLQKKIYQQLSRKGNSDTIGLRDEQLNMIAAYVGFPNYYAFEESFHSKRSAILDECIGTYYSYVRMNNRQSTVILRSPVQVFFEKDKYIMELHGVKNDFAGEVTLMDGCLFILLTAEVGKVIHHIYRIGKNKAPQVLQGVFSGVTSTFEPIGGRIVLVRVASDFNSLSPSEITDPSIQGIELEPLFRYLQDFEANNLSLKPATSCTMRDLS
jgi:hypothetical protein